MDRTIDKQINNNKKQWPVGDYIFVLATCFLIGIFVNGTFQIAINVKQNLSLNKGYIKDYCYKFKEEDGAPYYTNTDNDKYPKCKEYRYEKDIFKFSRILCVVSSALLAISIAGLKFTKRSK